MFLTHLFEYECIYLKSLSKIMENMELYYKYMEKFNHLNIECLTLFDYSFHEIIQVGLMY
jgi:hypothetical protein